MAVGFASCGGFADSISVAPELILSYFILSLPERKPSSPFEAARRFSRGPAAGFASSGVRSTSSQLSFSSYVILARVSRNPGALRLSNARARSSSLCGQYRER